MTAAAEPAIPIPLRRVHPPEAPYPGELVAGTAGRGYRVAAGDVPTLVWSAPPGGHLLAAVDLDVVDGVTTMLLPRLATRLSVESLVALSPGEAVTLGVSVVRGAAAAVTEGWRSGQWWLTEDGRPVLVPVGEEPWTHSTAELLAAIPAAAIDAGTRRRLIDALADLDALPRTADALEDALFAGAAPEPLQGLHGIRPGARAADRDDWPPGAPAAAGGPFAGVAALVDAGIRARLTAAYDGVRAAFARRRGSSTRSRTRPARGDADARDAGAVRAPARRLALVGTSVAAVILVAGLLWPSDRTNGTEAEPEARGSITRSATPDPATPDPATDGGEPAVGAEAEPQPSSSDAAPASPPGEGTHPAAATIEQLATCWLSSDLGCRAAVLERADATVPEGVATADVERSVVLLDDLGGVEVVRVEDAAGELPPQIVVVVVQNDERLVRDVYDVADQP